MVRDHEHTRFLWIGTGALVVVALVILGIGIYMDNVVRAGDPAAVVYGETITTADVVAEMRPIAQQLEAQYRTLAADAGDRAMINQQLDQQRRQLPPAALDELVEARIIAHEAAQRGITVTEEEVDARLREQVAAFKARNDAAASTPTDPAAAAPPVPTEVPTLEPAEFQAAFAQMLEQVNVSEARIRELIRRDVLREKVRTAVVADTVPATQEQIHARHILVPDEAQAQQVLARLEAGEDFAAVASEVSTDPGSKDRGGDLGWAARGLYQQEFEEAAFALQPGQRSGMVQTPFGYHIIEMIERDPNRLLEPEVLEQRQAQAFNTWLTEQRTGGADVRLEMSPSESDWTLRQIGVRP